MKFTLIAALAVLSGVHAAESASTTITCSSCPSAVTTPDIVTRSALPTTSCTEKPLTVVSMTKGGSGAAAPTGSGAASTPTAQVPVSGAGIKKGSVGGMAAAAVMVAVYVL
ncbi:uncharacterized protein FTJAE_2612 [Fusarium tjaetaba]|uniref:Uncharacterized protein n=1 Tax=Fusarium tjaetaba TaxID=1567544 RepID=A0A8H5W4H4_9HYPO|nr:uncharacterized protein FTJAE_2612 [Fusarium tjaetaba]KAF5644988.1 hypothetical protein FTJAE_2612 [Fusarium tjaetaba]